MLDLKMALGEAVRSVKSPGGGFIGLISPTMSLPIRPWRSMPACIDTRI
jgi:hypothetical protein